MKLKRQTLIDYVIKDLTNLRQKSDKSFHYSIDQNIAFFNAARSLPRYIYWLLTQYSRVDSHRILELSDFHLRSGLWEESLLLDLVRLEKSRMIDLVGPLREELLKQLKTIAPKINHPLVAINVGCGVMEIERQIIDHLIKSPLNVPVIFIGIDNSQAALDMSRANLRSYHGSFHVSNELTPELIIQLQQSGHPYEIQFIIGDAITSLSSLSPGILDLIYYSKFLHHLSDSDKENFENLLTRIAKRAIEFDDYRGIYLPLMSLLTNWRRPILLNGAVFSSLRVPSRSELHREDHGTEWTTKILPMKGYLKMYQRNSSGQ